MSVLAVTSTTVAAAATSHAVHVPTAVVVVVLALFVLWVVVRRKAHTRRTISTLRADLESRNSAGVEFHDSRDGRTQLVINLDPQLLRGALSAAGDVGGHDAERRGPGLSGVDPADAVYAGSGAGGVLDPAREQSRLEFRERVDQLARVDSGTGAVLGRGRFRVPALGVARGHSRVAPDAVTRIDVELWQGCADPSCTRPVGHEGPHVYLDGTAS